MNSFRRLIIAVFVLASVVLPAISFLPAFSGVAAALDAPDCTYTYSAGRATIERTDCQPWQVISKPGDVSFKKKSDTVYQYSDKIDGGDTCTTTITADSSGSASATITGQAIALAGTRPPHPFCADIGPTAISIVGGTGAADGGDGGDGSGDAASVTSCESQGVSLGWVICPVVDLAINFSEKLDALITNLLTTNTSMFDTSSSTGKSYYTAWNTFRIFGLVLIIIAGLIMIISEALGFDIFDAYTIKKVLPRIFIAAIAISLSWYLLEFLVNFTNDIGKGVESIIYYPFRTIGGLQLGTGASVIGLLATAGTLFFMTVGGVLSLALTAGLALLVAFLVLIIRQLVITFLIVIAPFAIACFILPNTEKMWKLWWDSLFKGLMMFPFIMGFIAIGHVFGATATSNTNNIDSINQIIGILAFFLPYFALPFTFRLAGGALATIGGLANDRSRGAFDRLKKFRANSTAMKHQRRMEGKTKFGSSRPGSMYRRFSSLGDPTSGAAASTFNPFAKNARAQYREHERKLLSQSSDEALKNDNGRFAGDDDLQKMVLNKYSRNKAVAEYAKLKYKNGTAGISMSQAEDMARSAIAGAESSYGTTWGSDTMRVTAAKAWAGSTTGADVGSKGWDERQKYLGEMVKDGLITSTDAAAMVKGNAKRQDGAGASFGEMVQYFDTYAKTGKSVVNGEEVTSKDMLHRAISGSQPGALMAGHKKAVQSANIVMKDEIADLAAQPNGVNSPEFKRKLAEVAARYEMMSQISPDSARVLADDRVDPDTGIANGIMYMQLGDHSVQDLIEQNRTDPDFIKMRREYQNAAQYQTSNAPQTGGPQTPGGS